MWKHGRSLADKLRVRGDMITVAGGREKTVSASHPEELAAGLKYSDRISNADHLRHTSIAFAAFWSGIPTYDVAQACCRMR